MTCCEHCYSDEADCTNQCPCHHAPHQNDYSQRDHTHCWESTSPPCGQKIEHLKCCLCELPNPKVPHQNEAEWAEFYEVLTQLTAEHGIWWCDTDNTRWNVTNNVDFTELLKSFIERRYVSRTQIAEVVDEIGKTHECSLNDGEQKCDCFYAALEALKAKLANPK